MDRLTECITELEKAGFDVLDVGCRWQENTPQAGFNLQGVWVFIGSALLLYLLNEIARNYFDSSV